MKKLWVVTVEEKNICAINVQSEEVGKGFF